MVDFRKVARNFFRTPNHDQVISYRRSTQFVKELRKIPVNADAYLEPTVPMAQQRTHVQSKLILDKNILDRKAEALKFADQLAIQKLELYEKEKEFQQQFKNFNILVMQNRVKRERVIGRTRDLIAMNTKRNEEIEHLSTQIRKMKEYKTKFITEINKYLFYEDFLDRISLEFWGKHSSTDMIQRFINLMSNREYLSKVDIDLTEQLKNTRIQTVKIVKERQQSILEMRKQVTDLITEYEKARSKTKSLEFLVLEIWQECSNRLEYLIECVYGIYNLNAQIFRRKRAYRMKVTITGKMKKIGILPAVMKKVVHINSSLEAMSKVSKIVRLCVRIVMKLAEKQASFRIQQNQLTNATKNSVQY